VDTRFHLKPGTHWRQSRKDVRHSGDKNHPLSTKSTELHVQLWRQCRPRQAVEFSFVASVYGRATVIKTGDKVERIGDSQLCRRFVAGIDFCRKPLRHSTLSPVCTGLNEFTSATLANSFAQFFTTELEPCPTDGV